VNRYVITITPDNGGAPSADTAHTTVRIDTSTGQTRITELTVRAASGGGLAPADLPPVDLDLLVRALTAPAPAQALPAGDEPATPPAQAQTPASASRQDAVSEPEKPAVDEPAAAPRRARKAGGRKAAAKKAGAAKKTTTAKKATAKKAAAPRRRAAAEAAPTTAGTRAYRRMPDPDQVMDVYRETGTITGVAEHFDVPRHTVAGWARRLRSMGHTIGRQ
jgi:hypothetical protein